MHFVGCLRPNIQTTQIHARITDQKVGGDMKMLSGKHPEPTATCTKTKERSKVDEELVLWAQQHGLNFSRP